MCTLMRRLVLAEEWNEPADVSPAKPPPQASWADRQDQPMITHQDQSGDARERKKCKQESEQHTRGKRLLLGYSRRVDHADHRDILGLLDAGQFILLREKLK